MISFIWTQFFTPSEYTGSVTTKDEIFVDDTGNTYLIDPKQIRSGGPPPDGIPSIDNPKFVTVSEADEWIQDNELVLVLTHNGVERVYPLQIMVWHEIVNDVVGGDALLITYCPLCGSGIAYSRELNGDVVAFGTSGKLYNSNLIMYDRKTESYWTQIDGLAINGDFIGTTLEAISIDTVSWGEWSVNHLDAEVLSQDTGFTREYGRDPYGNYYEDSFLMFPVGETDDRIFAKDVVFGITVNDVHKAYREIDVISDGPIEDKVGGVSLTVKRSDDGLVRIETDGGDEIVKERDFWFAWYAFHPDTLVYGFD